MLRPTSILKWLLTLSLGGLVIAIIYRLVVRPRRQLSTSTEGQAKYRQLPDAVWRLMSKLNRRVAVNYSQRSPLGRLVLLLTTTGRKSGLPRITPLQYEEVAGVTYVASARGQRADWFRNILADPHVHVQTSSQRFEAFAEPVTDPARIADFLELRLTRHPRMIRAMLLAHGLPAKPTRSNLQQLAADLALVVLKPDEAARERINAMKVWTYVFISTSQPRKVVRAVRQIPGVVKADALFGTPDAIAIVEGDDIAAMDTVIDRIVEVPEVTATDSKVARWID